MTAPPLPLSLLCSLLSQQRGWFGREWPRVRLIFTPIFHVVLWEAGTNHCLIPQCHCSAWNLGDSALVPSISHGSTAYPWHLSRCPTLVSWLCFEKELLIAFEPSLGIWGSWTKTTVISLTMMVQLSSTANPTFCCEVSSVKVYTFPISSPIPSTSPKILSKILFYTHARTCTHTHTCAHTYKHISTWFSNSQLPRLLWRSGCHATHEFHGEVPELSFSSLSEKNVRRKCFFLVDLPLLFLLNDATILGPWE